MQDMVYARHGECMDHFSNRNSEKIIKINLYNKKYGFLQEKEIQYILLKL